MEVLQIHDGSESEPEDKKMGSLTNKRNNPPELEGLDADDFRRIDMGANLKSLGADDFHWTDMGDQLRDTRFKHEERKVNRNHISPTPVTTSTPEPPIFIGDTHEAGRIAYYQKVRPKTAHWKELDRGQTYRDFPITLDEIKERERRQAEWQKRYEMGWVEYKPEPYEETQERNTARTGCLTTQEREERLTSWIMRLEVKGPIDPQAEEVTTSKRWGFVWFRDDCSIEPSERWADESNKADPTTSDVLMPGDNFDMAD